MTTFRARKGAAVRRPDVLQPSLPTHPGLGQEPLPQRPEEPEGVGRHNPRRVPVYPAFPRQERESLWRRWLRRWGR